MGAPAIRRTFDAAYYDRYYDRRRTRGVSPKDTADLAAFVTAYLRRLGLPLRTVLDLGCGLGLWRDALRILAPQASYTGVDPSPYLCERLGWRQASLQTFRSRSRYDLVICQSVLQYLDNAGVESALATMARHCRGLLYLEVVTAEDWRDQCDRDRTDGAIHRRSAAWYRRRIRPYFRSCGGGVFLPAESPVVLYALEEGR